MATEAPLTMIMPQLHQPRSRPNSLLIPPNPAYTPLSPRGGILMNAMRPDSLSPFTPSSGPYSSGFNTPRSPSPNPAALPDSTRMDRRQSVYSSVGSRKIRFAPLPEPRREVTVDDDGTEVPCAAIYSADATAFPAQSPGAGPSVALDRTDSLVTDSGASTNSTENETQSQKSAKRSKRNSLLRLVGLGGSSTLSKRPSTASLPVSDSGFIGNMFRTASRESTSGEPSGYSSDNSVARRLSSPLRPSSAGGRPSSMYSSFGAPLQHATSDGSGTRPQRMLNGRVYGGRRARERIQPQASMEPEFSEWGYGGMGSVNSGSEYSKLQSKTSSLGGPAGGDDEDDGSGMSWARKRKEKREREAREKKEAEEAAAKAAAETQSKAEDTSNPPRASTETTGSSTTVHAERSETPTAPQTPTGPAPPTRTGSTAMSSPRPRTISSPPTRQNSAATVTPDRHHPTVVAVPAHRGRQEGSMVNSSVVTSPETSPERSSGSSRRSSTSDDDEAEDSSKDEEEEEEENQKRKTALSAGVEKISRHH